MENQTRFDLNAAIECWRNELAAQSNLTPDDRRELETHMRDTMAELSRHGLNDEEAFWLACRRIGEPQQLGEEFVKADPAKIWRERVFWIAAGSLVVTFWAELLGYIPLHNWMAHPISPYVYTSIIYLPPIFIAALLVSGRMNTLICTFIRSLRSRLWLGIWAMTFICIRAPQSFIAYATDVHVHTPNSEALQMIRFNLFSGLIWPLALIALIAWLLPSQKRMTPKSA